MGFRKTVIYILAILLTACSKDSVEQPDETKNSLITFTISGFEEAPVITRAKVLSSIADLQDTNTDIRVAATYQNGTDPLVTYFENVRLNYSSGKWVLANNYYWLPTQNLDFLADIVSGNRSDFNATFNKPYTFTYSVPTDITKQHDYTYAVKHGVSRAAYENTSVPLEFKHALSQIIFTGSVAENWNVTIKSITIKNISKSGTFNYGTGLWSGLDTQNNSYVFTLATPKVFNGQSQPEELLASSSEPSERLVLMPQVLNPWTPKVGDNRIPITTADVDHLSYVEIECKIQERLNNNYIVGGSSAYGKIYASLSGTWEPNKKYIYNLPFGAGYTNDGKKTIELITLSATIVDWTAGNTYDNGQAKFD